MQRRRVLTEEIEEHRDSRWRRSEPVRVETVEQAERFIEHVGFGAFLSDSRHPGPSLYLAVCGRRDAVKPRNVQTDPETSRTWQLKDEIMRRGRVYYGKLSRGKAMFLARRMIPHFKALWGIPERREAERLSPAALTVLAVLRREWEMATADLRSESGITGRKAFTQAMDELQAAMLAVPSDAVYEPRFTYLWELATERFPKELSVKTNQHTAVCEVARCFLDGAGMTVPGELARVTGLTRLEAGIGNKLLVKEGYATPIARGTYRLASL